MVEVTGIPEPDFNHIAACTPLTYATNPPSGGDHWPIWAAYKKYTTPVPREMYVHDLEHGAIVLAYRCAGACPDVVAALSTRVRRDGRPALPLHPRRARRARGAHARSRLLATPIAAAAWGATYTATCIDVPSLRAFANAHYGQGREQLCTDGIDVEKAPPCAPVDAGRGARGPPRAPHPQPRAGG